MGQGLSARVDLTRLSAEALIHLYDTCTQLKAAHEARALHLADAAGGHLSMSDLWLRSLYWREAADVERLQRRICLTLMREGRRAPVPRLRPHMLRVLTDFAARH